MEIVLAADSDERGLAFLKVIDVFKNFITFIQSYFVPGDSSVDQNRSVHSDINGPPTGEDCDHSEITVFSGDRAGVLDLRRESWIQNYTATPPFLKENKLISDIETVMPTMNDNEIAEKIRSLCSNLILSDEILRDVCETLDKELDKGLGKDTNKSANVKCFPTYVRELPNGKERGRFLALDLGGTNFRVLLIELDEEVFKMDSKIFAVPQDIMLGSGEQLFDHIAKCLALFIAQRDLSQELLPLGFTFSFPCSQEGLTKARLTQWTKGFKCSGVEGNDVVEMLKAAITRRSDVRIKVCAVLNDTTGTLMSCAWKNQDCRIGLILGTGSNACYMEKLSKVELYDESKDDEEGGQVVVNTEWGAFGENGCLSNVLTDYDYALDRESLNPGKQLFEKMISGMYMGEIVRHVLVHLVREGLLFGGTTSPLLEQKGSFYTKYVSEIEEQDLADTSKALDILEELGLCHASEADCRNVRVVCELVSRRAAFLAAAGTAVLMNRMDEDRITVAVDGSVYRYHPHFHNLMVEKITDLAAKGKHFDLMLSEDGSGRGAALVAAVASRNSESAKKS